jgi:hypothetical protein
MSQLDITHEAEGFLWVGRGAHVSAEFLSRLCTLEAAAALGCDCLVWRCFVGFIFCKVTKFFTFEEAVRGNFLRNWAAIVRGTQVNNAPEKAADNGKRLTPRFFYRNVATRTDNSFMMVSSPHSLSATD